MSKQPETMSKAKILVIDDDPNVLELSDFHLKSSNYEVATTESGEEGVQLAEHGDFDLVLTDLQLPDIDGIQIVKRLKESIPQLPIIMISGYGSDEKAREATREGAFYFINKPIEYDELMLLIERALEHGSQKREIRRLRRDLEDRASYHNIIGSSKAMQTIYALIDSVAESDANVLIIGETGTGKELIANAVHYRSLRAKKPLVKVNCSALPKELIESELFGHTKGAFTGATGEKTGLIGQSNGGSLFLDEIGEMPTELQPKLLRVLQERIYYRVGSEKPLSVDFRLISATNRDPLQAVQEGLLREDLYYRINTILIQVPPLRERAEDIQRLAEYFLKLYAERNRRPARSFTQEAYGALFAHRWPGNVRELQNVIERAVLLCKEEEIDAVNLPLEQMASMLAPAPVAAPQAPAAPAAARPIYVNSTPAAAAATAPASASAPQELLDLCRAIISKTPLPQVEGESMDMFALLEGPLVTAALERTKGNKQAAANLLGIYRPRLYSIIRKHKLRDEGKEA